ncbi:hypothetical protein CYMTET_40483 [Cymbomonas tetramitiformis]|uniref:Beta-carotene isomerase D27-like C-terminal domain-containing protein n=1 Tax=Cymbomonas tetramitiformis TaxID=36881 RepID=A0AAE0F3L0_9CHLO|nr:hypothetical protein CYMTET_40483 [Cymbomonas tetramitiformis]
MKAINMSLSTSPHLVGQKATILSKHKTFGSKSIPSSRNAQSRSSRCIVRADGSPVAWRGDDVKKSSLPILPNGKVDYTSIDRSPISMVLTATIRKLLVAEVGKDSDPRPWTEFDAVLTPVREVNDMVGTAEDVQGRARRVFEGILPALGIGWVPPLWRKFVQPAAPQWLSNYAFVLVFTNLFPWLMGPMEGVDHVDVPLPKALRDTFRNLPETIKLPQTVKAERCRFLESSSCASVCVNSCKVPSQNWLRDDFGMNMHIQPNYDDYSCQWKFGLVPPPLAEDEAVMVPCFANCPSEYKGEKDAIRQRMRAAAGFGIENGVDKYTGETLEQIAARASALAVSDAQLSITKDGSANSEDTLQLREEVVRGGGKCWSVDEERLEKISSIKASEV